ncbi:MAG TPA: hypothetical protein PLJ48_06845, partial [Dermatophilaceae bacterium]|nr:hypothetical protein [Dermatophilaceae bacterium]
GGGYGSAPLFWLAEALREHGSGLIKQSPGPAALGVQAPRIGPPSLPGRGHRLACRRVDGTLRGIEERPAGVPERRLR